MSKWKVWLKQGEHIIQTKPKGHRKTGCGVHTTVTWDRGFVVPYVCNGVLYPGDTISFRVG